MKKARFLTAALVAVQVTALTMMSAASVSAADEAKTGTAATPDNPYYAWAADEKPDMTGAVNLLDTGLTITNPNTQNVGINSDGEFFVKHNAFNTTFLEGYDTPINLEETPCLYWSFEQAPDTGSRVSFRLGFDGAYAVSRYSAETESGKLLTQKNIEGARGNFIAGNETGCINLYEWYEKYDIPGTSKDMLNDLTLNRLTIYTGTDGSAVDATINYLFFGPDPAKATTTEATTTTTEEPTTTTEATTEATTEPTTAPTQAPVEIRLPVSLDPADWSTKNADEMVIAKGADGSLELSNTNGLWPAAGIALDKGITFDPAVSKLVYDITVGPNTNINLFFNGETPNPNEFEENSGKHMSIAPYIEGADHDAGSGDIVGNGATFKGEIDLSKMEINGAAYNEDGTLTLTGVNIYTAGAAGSKVVVRDLSIVTLGEGGDTTTAPVEPTTTASETETTASETNTTDTTITDTTTADGTDVTTGSAATTTSAQKDNPKTGDNGAMMVGGVALLVLSSGALLLTLKKAKSR